MRILFFSLTLLLWLQAQDPYKNIVHYTLDNGLKVYLLPSSHANNIAVKVEVNTGTFAETKANLGVSHLLEHLLFRSPTLKKGETYLQVLEDEGAQANAETNYFTTDYMASIESSKGAWMVERFAQILGDRNLSGLDVSTEKKTVAVEIGKVSFLRKFLGFDAEQFFEYDYFPPVPVYTSEFNLTLPPFSQDTVRISTKHLTLQTIQQYYNDYYCPDNMVLFIAGNFDLLSMKKIIQTAYGSILKRKGKKLSKPKATMRKKAYFKVPRDSLDTKAIISVGTKYNELTLQERLVLMAYLEDLAQRLMKELRNLEGKTYTASTFNEKFVYAGIAGIYLDTTKEVFESTYKTVKDKIYQETQEKKLSLKDYQRMMQNYYHQNFEGIPSDAQTLLTLEEAYHDHRTRYDNAYNAHTAFEQITYAVFTHTLSELFKPEHAFTILERENLFFEDDMTILPLMSFIITLFLLHAFYSIKLGRVGILMNLPINHTINYRLALIFLTLFTFILIILIKTPLTTRLYPYFNLFNGISLWDSYLWICFIQAPLLAWIFYYILGIPKKSLLVSNNELLLLGLRSIKLPVSKIKKLQIIKSKFKDIFFSRQKHYGWLWRKNKQALLVQTEDETYIIWIHNAQEVLHLYSGHTLGLKQN